MSNIWFRLHADMLSDEKVLSLAFSDRWFFVAVMCLKCEGMQDKYQGENLDRKVAIRLGISRSEAEELKARLIAEDLISRDWTPVAWDKRQYKSDSSAERVARHRAKQKQQDSGLKRSCNVTVTPPDTDTDTDTDIKNKVVQSADAELATSLYNRMASSLDLPQVQKLTETRRRKLVQRLKDCGGIEGWQCALDEIGQSPFLTGQNNRGWKADFDFLLQERSFTKLMEGAYRQAKSQREQDFEFLKTYAMGPDA